MLLEIGLLGATLLLWLYWYIAKNFGKWEKLGFPCISGTFPWGSYKGIHISYKMLESILSFKKSYLNINK